MRFSSRTGATKYQDSSPESIGIILYEGPLLNRLLVVRCICLIQFLQMIHVTAASSLVLFSLTFSATSLIIFLSDGRWEILYDGELVTSFLSQRARLSNGDPVTAEDFSCYKT